LCLQGATRPSLVVFLAPQGGHRMSEDQLQTFCAGVTNGLNEALATRVPEYMIPSLYFSLGQIPMTATGAKADRARLRRMAESIQPVHHRAAQEGQGCHQAPRSTSERRLQSLWATVLSRPVQEISCDDSFMRLGGDSISAMQLVATARNEGLLLQVGDILARPRLSDMAAALCTIDNMPCERKGESPVPAPFTLLQNRTFSAPLTVRAKL
jgi:aryl carrier-like protein